MPKVRKMTEPVKDAGKKVLATDTAQNVIGAVVDSLEDVAVDKADDAADAIKVKAAKVAGRKKPTAKKAKKK